MQRTFLRVTADEIRRIQFFGIARIYREMAAKIDLELIQLPMYFGKHWQEDIGTAHLKSLSIFCGSSKKQKFTLS